MKIVLLFPNEKYLISIERCDNKFDDTMSVNMCVCVCARAQMLGIKNTELRKSSNQNNIHFSAMARI